MDETTRRRLQFHAEEHYGTDTIECMVFGEAVVFLIDQHGQFVMPTCFMKDGEPETVHPLVTSEYAEAQAMLAVHGVRLIAAHLGLETVDNPFAKFNLEGIPLTPTSGRN